VVFVDYDIFLDKRIPLDVRNKDRLAFGFLRSIVRQNSIRTTEQLNNHVLAEIDFHRRWLAKNKTSSTINKHRRHAVHKLQYLMKVKGLLDSHLK